jgi:hypothetical protein
VAVVEEGRKEEGNGVTNRMPGKLANRKFCVNFER